MEDYDSLLWSELESQSRNECTTNCRCKYTIILHVGDEAAVSCRFLQMHPINGHTIARFSNSCYLISILYITFGRDVRRSKQITLSRSPYETFATVFNFICADSDKIQHKNCPVFSVNAFLPMSDISILFIKIIHSFGKITVPEISFQLFSNFALVQDKDYQCIKILPWWQKDVGPNHSFYWIQK